MGSLKATNGDDGRRRYESAPLRREPELRVSRIGDQSSEFLREVERMGLRPGSRLRVEARNAIARTVEVHIEPRGSLNLGSQAASKIFVDPA